MNQDRNSHFMQDDIRADCFCTRFPCYLALRSAASFPLSEKFYFDASLCRDFASERGCIGSTSPSATWHIHPVQCALPNILGGAEGRSGNGDKQVTSNYPLDKHSLAGF